jgi:hypothetical protein
MKLDHSVDFTLEQRLLLKDMFQQPSRVNEGQCNLCMRHSSKLKSHVSRHLQQMALFALPRVNETSGSGVAELNTAASRDNSRVLRRRTRAAVFDISPSTSDTEESRTIEETERIHSSSPPKLSGSVDSLQFEDDIQVVDVPDAADLDWDEITTKFSSARHNESEKRYVAAEAARKQEYVSPFSNVAIAQIRRVGETLGDNPRYHTFEGTTLHVINQYIIKKELERGFLGPVHLAIDQYGTEYVSDYNLYLHLNGCILMLFLSRLSKFTQKHY